MLKNQTPVTRTNIRTSTENPSLFLVTFAADPFQQDLGDASYCRPLLVLGRLEFHIMQAGNTPTFRTDKVRMLGIFRLIRVP